MTPEDLADIGKQGGVFLGPHPVWSKGRNYNAEVLSAPLKMLNCVGVETRTQPNLILRWHELPAILDTILMTGQRVNIVGDDDAHNDVQLEWDIEVTSRPGSSTGRATTNAGPALAFIRATVGPSTGCRPNAQDC